MFAWAKHAQPTEVPDDVGFSLQPDEYLVLQVRVQQSTLIIFLRCQQLQVHYAKPQQNDHSGLAVMVRQAKPTYTAGDIDSDYPSEASRLTHPSRHVPSASVPFGNSSIHPCRAWRCQLPSKLEVLIALEH